MVVRLDASLVRRIPLDGTFMLRYVPYSPDFGILYREDADAGCFVESDGSKGWKTRVVGDALVRVLDHPSVAMDKRGVCCGRNRVVERDLSKHTFSLGVARHYVSSFGGVWWREGNVLVVANDEREIVWAKHISEDEWNSVSDTFPPPQSPTPNS